MNTTPPNNERLLELLAGEQLGDLTIEEREELEALREGGDVRETQMLGELLITIDSATSADETLPQDLASRIASTGKAVVGGPDIAGGVGGARGRLRSLAALAACLILALGATFFAFHIASKRAADLRAWQAERVALLERVESNERLLADSRDSVEQLRQTLAQSETLTEQQRTEIAARAERELDLAERLAAATSEVGDLQRRIALLDGPPDAEALALNRRRLIEVPGTFVRAWEPFDLPDNPAEQRLVEGDVVWNDELQEGYLRFVGLKPNDPSVEQYQVWVIDERGGEQKVSGGVFDATAEGEVIVPIDPAIDVGRVALFAVTIEEPGGIWVPDLRRRVVKAEREEG